MKNILIIIVRSLLSTIVGIFFHLIIRVISHWLHDEAVKFLDSGELLSWSLWKKFFMVRPVFIGTTISILGLPLLFGITILFGYLISKITKGKKIPATFPITFYIFGYIGTCSNVWRDNQGSIIYPIVFSTILLALTIIISIMGFRKV